MGHDRSLCHFSSLSFPSCLHYFCHILCFTSDSSDLALISPLSAKEVLAYSTGVGNGYYLPSVFLNHMPSLKSNRFWGEICPHLARFKTNGRGHGSRPTFLSKGRSCRKTKVGRFSLAWNWDSPWETWTEDWGAVAPKDSLRHRKPKTPCFRLQ